VRRVQALRAVSGKGDLGTRRRRDVSGGREILGRHVRYKPSRSRLREMTSSSPWAQITLECPVGPRELDLPVLSP